MITSGAFDRQGIGNLISVYLKARAFAESVTDRDGNPIPRLWKEVRLAEEDIMSEIRRIARET